MIESERLLGLENVVTLLQRVGLGWCAYVFQKVENDLEKGCMHSEVDCIK